MGQAQIARRKGDRLLFRSSLRWSVGVEWATGRMAPSWLKRPAGWLAAVNGEEDEAELSGVRRSLMRGAPFGQDAWVKQVAKLLGLQSSLRPRGRPKKENEPSQTAEKVACPLFAPAAWPREESTRHARIGRIRIRSAMRRESRSYSYSFFE